MVDGAVRGSAVIVQILRSRWHMAAGVPCRANADKCSTSRKHEPVVRRPIRRATVIRHRQDAVFNRTAKEAVMPGSHQPAGHKRRLKDRRQLCWGPRSGGGISCFSYSHN